MMKNRVLNQLTVGAVALLIGGGVMAAPQNLPQNPDAVIVSLPLDITDEGGARIQQAVVTYKGQTYEVNLNGLGIGGEIKGKGFRITGQVYGLSKVTDLEGTYVTELALDKSSGKASSSTLWLYSDSGVSIHLQTNYPNLRLASGGDMVTLAFP